MTIAALKNAIKCTMLDRSCGGNPSTDSLVVRVQKHWHRTPRVSTVYGAHSFPVGIREQRYVDDGCHRAQYTDTWFTALRPIFGNSGMLLGGCRHAQHTNNRPTMFQSASRDKRPSQRHADDDGRHRISLEVAHSLAVGVREQRHAALEGLVARDGHLSRLVLGGVDELRFLLRLLGVARVVGFGLHSNAQLLTSVNMKMLRRAATIGHRSETSGREF